MSGPELEEQLPPHDIRAEMAVLGAMLTWPSALADAVGALQSRHFYRAANQIVFEAVCAVHGHGKPVDPVTVLAELECRGQVPKIGDATYLVTLQQSVTTVASVGEHIRIVAERARLRQVAEDATRLLQRIYAGADLADVEAEAARIPAGALRETGRLGQLRAALLDSAALDSVPPPQPVIDGLLYRNGIAWLYGKPGTYKSIIAIDWACCVSTGLPWQEHETVQGPVLYVYIEGVPGLRQRVRAWEDRAACKSGVIFLPVAVQLLNPVDLAAFAALVAELGAVLVVIDTQAHVTVGVEENSAMEMGKVVDAAGALYRAAGSCVLILHHEGRAGETPRGSIAIDGAATSLFRTERDGDRITLKNTRQRDTAEADDLALYAVELLGSVVVANSRDRWEFGAPKADSGTKILAVMGEVFAGISASPSQLIDASGLPKTTTYRALSSLVTEGKLVNTGTASRPRYELPSGNFPQLPTADAAGTSQIPAPGGSFRTPGGGNFGTPPDEHWPEGGPGEAANS